MRAVFFDVGGTLLRPWPSVGAVYARVACRYGWQRSATELETAFRAAWKQTPPVAGLTTSSREWWRQLVSRVVPGASDEFFEELYGAFTLATAWEILPGVRAALTEARRRGLHLGVISNWDDRLRPLLRNVGLTDWDSITISCEVGVEKPGAAIFQAALRSAGVLPGEALHLGDSLAEDVHGAQAVGMHARLVERPGDLWPAVCTTL